MPNLKFQIPKENIEPEIEALMTIPQIDLDPRQFEAHVREEDIADLGKRDKKVILAMSILQQQQEALFNAVLWANYYARQREAQAIRRDRRLEKEREEERKAFEAYKLHQENKVRALDGKSKLDIWKLIRIAITTALAAAIGALFERHTHH